jgi:hypothetical protein
MSGDDPPLFGKAPNGFLDLLERAHLDLSDALPANVINVAQLLERLRFVDEPALGENVALPLGEVPRDKQDESAASIKMRIGCWGVGGGRRA